MAGYLFGGNTGISSPQELEKRRAIADALAGSALRAPKDVGEGLTAIGQALAFRMMDRRNRKDAAAGQEAGNNAFASLFSGMGGPDTSAPDMAGGTAVAPQPPMDPASSRVAQAHGVTAGGGGGGNIEAYIRQAAAARGIDPDVAIAVAKSEGGLKDPFRQSDVVKNGVREQSYGPFQLYMAGGLGNKALEAGIDPRKNWQGGIDFALDQAAKDGWGPWYGAKKIGVTGMHGIGQRPPSQQVASLDPSAGMPAPQMTPDQVTQSFTSMRGNQPPPMSPAPQMPSQERFGYTPGQMTMPLGQTAPMSAPPGQNTMPMGLAAANAPPAPTPQPPMPPQPAQMAQAGQGQFPPAPQAPQAPDRIQQLMQAAQNLWLNEQQRGMVNTMLQQEMEKQQQASDPMRQLQMQKLQSEVDAAKNPTPSLINGGEGRLYDPAKKEWITAPDASAKAPQVVELFDEDSGQPYKATWNAETKQYDRVGGVKARSGMQLTTNPDGTVSLTEGPITNRPKLTEGEAKNAGFLERGLAANEVLKSLEGEGTSLWNKTIGNAPIVGNYARSEDAQKYDQAKRDLVNAILRRESGAVISDEEFANAEQQYFPQPGDGPQVIEQKRKNREAAIKGFDIGAGQGAGMVTNPPGQVKRLKFNPETGELE